MSPTSFHCSTPLSEDTARGLASSALPAVSGGSARGSAWAPACELGLGLGDPVGLAVGDALTVGDAGGLKVGIGTDTPPVEGWALPG